MHRSSAWKRMAEVLGWAVVACIVAVLLAGTFIGIVQVILNEGGQ